MYKKFLFFILITLCFYGCAATYTMHNAYNSYFSKNAIDSICVAEHLPSIKMGPWNAMAYVDEETGAKVEQYVYTRTIKENKKTTVEQTFICTDLDTVFKLNKRILIKEK